MESRFGYDFSQVRLHTDRRAAESALGKQARAFTSGNEIVFGREQYAPRTVSGQRLLAHELAHVVQQGRRDSRPAPAGAASGPGLEAEADAAAEQAVGGATVRIAGRAPGRVLQFKTDPAAGTHGLESYPEEERKKLSVLTVKLDSKNAAKIEDFFETAPNFILPSQIKLDLSSQIDAKTKPGLTSVATSLVNPAGPVLPPNTTMSIAIKAAGKVYRFARFDHLSPAAGAATGTTEVLLVEELGEVRGPTQKAGRVFETKGHGSTLPYREATELNKCMEVMGDMDYCREAALGEKPLPQPPEKALDPNKVKIKGQSFTRGANWKAGEWEQVSAALESLPDSVLKNLNGISLERKPKKVCKEEEVKAKTCNPEVGGETPTFGNSIILFDKAFAASTTRYGTSTSLERLLAHEIGHRLDLAPLRSAAATRDPDKIKKARARSGVFLKPGKKLAYTHYPASDKGAFQVAAAKDGLVLTDSKVTVGSITEYGKQDSIEQFAELFSIYETDPDLLRAIRPNVYKYFADAYSADPAKKP